jgi:hypothetical protein
LYENPLFKWSGVEIPALQKGLPSSEWKFWDFYTHIGGGLLQVVYFAIHLVFNPNKNETVVLSVNLSIELFLMTITKVWHHQARPFWAYSDVRAGACYKQFGNPSGHSLFSAFFAMYLFNRYFLTTASNDQHSSILSMRKTT